MVILLLSPYSQGIRETIHKYCDAVVSSNEPPEAWSSLDYDWIVSYGYRYIIRPDVIAKFRKKIINIHISALPYNRGADPNFWSWVDGTPKGVTIHEIDEGIDSGPMYSEMLVSLHDKHTLRSSYEELRRLAEGLFAISWPGIRDGTIVPQPQPTWWQGRPHRSKDKDAIFAKLPLGWDTPVAELPAALLPSGL